jgi:hypothetical protein
MKLRKTLLAVAGITALLGRSPRLRATRTSRSSTRPAIRFAKSTSRPPARDTGAAIAWATTTWITKSRLFKFSDKASCDQDLKVVFADSDAEVTWDNVDLCEINKISIK